LSKPVTLVVRREGKDRFGRTLATVYAGGTDVGAALVYEGLARWWEGRRESWC
jgi:micrococcal nuclease